LTQATNLSNGKAIQNTISSNKSLPETPKISSNSPTAIALNFQVNLEHLYGRYRPNRYYYQLRDCLTGHEVLLSKIKGLNATFKHDSGSLSAFKLQRPVNAITKTIDSFISRIENQYRRIEAAQLEALEETSQLIQREIQQIGEITQREMANLQQRMDQELEAVLSHGEQVIHQNEFNNFIGFFTNPFEQFQRLYLSGDFVENQLQQIDDIRHDKESKMAKETNHALTEIDQATIPLKKQQELFNEVQGFKNDLIAELSDLKSHLLSLVEEAKTSRVDQTYYASKKYIPRMNRHWHPK